MRSLRALWLNAFRYDEQTNRRERKGRRSGMFCADFEEPIFTIYAFLSIATGGWAILWAVLRMVKRTGLSMEINGIVREKTSGITALFHCVLVVWVTSIVANGQSLTDNGRPVGGGIPPAQQAEARRIGELFHELEEMGEQEEKSERGLLTAEQYARTRLVVEELSGFGDKLVPFAVEALRPGKTPFFTRQILQSIAHIYDTRLFPPLLDLVLHDTTRQNSSVVIASDLLRKMANRNGGHVIPISREEFTLLRSKALSGPKVNATPYLELVPYLDGVSVSEKGGLILERLRLLLHWEDWPRSRFVLVSPKVYNASLLIPIAAKFGQDIWPFLSEKRMDALRDGEKELASWITILLASAGDKSVTEALGEIVLSHEDPSVRYVAIPLYAELSKETGIPLLRQAVEDSALSDNMRHPEDDGQIPFVAVAAAEALAKLGEEAPSLDELRAKFGIEVPSR